MSRFMFKGILNTETKKYNIEKVYEHKQNIYLRKTYILTELIECVVGWCFVGIFELGK